MKYLLFALVLGTLHLGAIPEPVISIDFENGFDARTRKGTLPAAVSGTPRLVKGRSGLALESGPGTGYLEFPHKNLINGKNGTIEMWVKRVNWKPDDREFHVFFETLDGKGWLVFYKYSQGSKIFMLSGVNRQREFNVGVYTAGYNHYDTFARHESPQKWKDDWAHLVGVWSEEGNTVYLNGVPGKLHPAKEYSPPGAPDIGTRFRIGDHPWPLGSRTSSSLIDSVKLYDRALSGSEVRELYHSSIYGKQIPLRSDLMNVTYYGDVKKREIHFEIHTGGAVFDPNTTVRGSLAPAGSTDRTAVGNFRFISPTRIQGALPFPRSTGQYELTLDIPGRITFRHKIDMPDFSWFGNSMGLERKVLNPWTPGRVEGNTFHCWGREYRFGNSALPEQIVSAGRELLSSPVRIEACAENSPIRWHKQSVRCVSSDPAGAVFGGEMHGTTPAGEVKITTRAELEYDGFVRIQISADKPERISSLALLIPLKKEHAMYHHKYSTQRQGCSGNIPEGSGVVAQSSFLPFTWFGDNDRGLYWCCESQEFWPNGEAQDACAEIRSANSVTMRFQIQSEGQELGKSWKYEFALQATPVKPLPKHWRRHRFITWENNSMRDWPGATVGYFNWGANHVGSKMGYPESSNSAILKQQIAAARAKGVILLPYLNLSCQPTFCPEWNFFGRQWRMGYQDQDPVDIDRRHAYAAVSAGNRDYSDFVVWKLDRYMREMGLDGQYHDNTFPYSSSLPESGCGFTRNGRRYPSFNIFATRALLRRNRAVMQAWKKDAFTLAHMSSKVWIPALAYEDAMVNGEHFRGRIGDSYPEMLPMDMFRAEYMGRQWGLIPVVMSELSRENAAKVEPTRGLITMLMLHDTKLWVRNRTVNHEVVIRAQKALDRFGYADTEFIPYFDSRPPARCVHPGVYVSAYRKAADRSVLLIVGNLKRNAVECEIGIDGKRLDMTPASAADWQTGETLKLDNGKIRLKVEGQGYRLIRVQNFQVPEINIWG